MLRRDTVLGLSSRIGVRLSIRRGIQTPNRGLNIGCCTAGLYTSTVCLFSTIYGCSWRDSSLQIHRIYHGEG